MAVDIISVGVVFVFMVMGLFGLLVLFAACKIFGGLMRSPAADASLKHLPKVQCDNALCRSHVSADARFCGRCGQIMYTHDHQPRVTKPLAASA